jgi:hypothetical protein
VRSASLVVFSQRVQFAIARIAGFWLRSVQCCSCALVGQVFSSLLYEAFSFLNFTFRSCLSYVCQPSCSATLSSLRWRKFINVWMSIHDWMFLQSTITRRMLLSTLSEFNSLRSNVLVVVYAAVKNTVCTMTASNSSGARKQALKEQRCCIINGMDKKHHPDCAYMLGKLILIE